MQLQLKRISAITLASALLVCMVFVYRLSSAYTRAPWLAKPRATIAITVYPSILVKSPARRPTSIPTSISVANASTQVQTSTALTTTSITLVPEVREEALPVSAQLGGIRHQQQTWNNCGPATLSMLMSYFNYTDTQQVIGAAIKPYKDDKNVGPDELLSYAQSAGLKARIIVGGDIDMLKRLVAHDFPVIVESWFIPEPGDEMGHYQLVVGYEADTLSFFDSYHGPNIQHSVAEFDGLWRVFNRLAIVVWRLDQEEQMRSLLGERWDETRMNALALADAQRESQADPRDKFAWFNIGSTLLRQGDSAGAMAAYDTAIALRLPWRMMWYQFGPYEAYFAQKRYDEVVKLTSATLRVKVGLEESYFWRARAYAALGKPKLAQSDLNQALVYRPSFAQAQLALNAIAP